MRGTNTRPGTPKRPGSQLMAITSILAGVTAYAWAQDSGYAVELVLAGAAIGVTVCVWRQIGQEEEDDWYRHIPTCRPHTEYSTENRRENR